MDRTSPTYPSASSAWTNPIAGASAGLQPDDGADPLLGGERGHRPGVVEVAAQWPLAVDGLAGGNCGGDEFSMVRDPDRNSDHVDVRLDHHLLVV